MRFTLRAGVGKNASMEHNSEFHLYDVFILSNPCQGF